MIWRRKKIGLALGGGGARGMAHIGVLRVFEKQGIPIDIIVGTSIGALVGACYACGFDSFDLERRVDDFLNTPDFQNSAFKNIKEIQKSKKLSFTQKIQAFFKNQFILTYAMFRAGILQYEDFQAMVDFFVPDVRIEDCNPPFRAVAADIASGQAVVLSRGPLRKAVMASCAVPAAVPPVDFDGRLLCDGGVVHLVPTTVARDEGAEFVVAVSVNSDIRSSDEFYSAMDIYVRSTEIMCYHLEKCRLEKADVVIHPEVGDLHWTDFTLASDLIEFG
ncbi:MAG: patatin-like phospholipase family protein, partial [Deltaproteobacteria bacterium]|nr:patatin-like phospholipase family protein [Deltaproteobacteria bacterium]MBW2083234.1 patatin-like phospholipase family protein [Deltaproteobacteria bacterium]